MHVLARNNTYFFNMVDGSMVSITGRLRRTRTSAKQGSTVFDFRTVAGKYVETESQKDAVGQRHGLGRDGLRPAGAREPDHPLLAAGLKLAYSVTHHDAWGNVNFTQDYDGHDTYYAYAGTKGQYQFGNGRTGLIQKFYTNSTIDRHIHTDLLGTAEFQDPANSKTPIETFYLYNNDEVLKEAQLYSSASGP